MRFTVGQRPIHILRQWSSLAYLEGKINFPFQAQCVAPNAISPLCKGETVEVLRLATEDACEHDMLVQIHWQGGRWPFPFTTGDHRSRRNNQRGHRRLALLGCTRLPHLIYTRLPEAHRVYTRITPLGFDRQGDQLVPNATEMKTVRRILALRSKGLSMQAIADAMRRAGAPTKQGGSWHAMTIRKILRPKVASA